MLWMWAGGERDGAIALEARTSRDPAPMPAAASLEVARAPLDADSDPGREMPARIAVDAAVLPLGGGAPARDYLAEHYGPRWPEAEARIEAWGQVDLDMPYYQRPWEEVEHEFEAGLPMLAETREALIQARVRWPAVVTPEFLRDEFGLGSQRVLDASELLAVEVLTEPWNQELAALAQLYTERVDAHVLERWASGRYLRAPFTTGGLDDRLGFHSLSTGGHGWALTITLSKDECPDVQELEHRIGILKEERDLAVVTFLAQGAR